MLLTDYFRSQRDLTWDYARQCGVEHGVIRLPETKDFNINDEGHWKQVYKNFIDFGITPVVIEPMPNELHDHIKIGDEKRDEAIEKVIKMFPIMESLNIRTICFNFMAHIGWLRTRSDIKERGDAYVTGFDIKDFKPVGERITSEQLWNNYEYFIKAVIPFAEKHGIKLALHPDDPPLERLGDVERIMISYENIKKAISIVDSDNLGVTMCQATYLMMGEDLYDVIPKLADKIFFVHFRNAVGNKLKFNETFHDNGLINMSDIMKLYKKCNVDVPIRVDHVPLMAGENQDLPGYTALGRLFAIGYLKGILEST
ncbi:MAG: mannonate dehydratase [Clostridia bacterium]|nr:mannonate dehydratase [Clostridia bacterium]